MGWARTTTINVLHAGEFRDGRKTPEAAYLDQGLYRPKGVRSHSDAHQTATKITAETASVFLKALMAGLSRGVRSARFPPLLNSRAGTSYASRLLWGV